MRAGLSLDQQRQIAITNLFSITIALITLPWVAVFAGIGVPLLGVGVLAVSTLCATSLLLNARGRHRLARLWLLAWSNAAVFAFAIALGPDSGIALLFTATTCAPLALFDPRHERVPFVIGVVTPVALSAGAQRFGARHAPLVPLSERTLNYLFPALLFTTLVVLLFIISYYYYVYERTRATREREHRAEQARLDSALRESEQRYALASQGANDGLWEWGATSDEVFYSERWKAMLGFEPSEIGTSFREWLERVHPGDKMRVELEIRDHMVGRSERLISEHRVQCKDGHYRWMLTRGLAIRDPAGHATRMAGWMTDVTERRLSQERLKESEQLSRQLLAQAADALYFFRFDGRILEVNQQAVADLGYTHEELLQMTLFDIDRSLTAEELRLWTERIPASGASTLERMHTRSDGRLIAVELRLGRFKYGSEKHLLASARDISVRKEMEAQLMLADRMSSVGTLAAGVAHEINNPLTSLLLNLELIDRQLADLSPSTLEAFRERAERALQRAREGAERVGVIVRDLKTFSRGEVEEREAVDLRQVVASTLNLAHPELKRRASVRADLPADLPAVRANEARLGQVFLNLLLNALQSFDHGDPFAHVITIRVRADQDTVVAEVIDNGVGIADSVKARIFDPFFTTKPVGVGTGLGLYICRNIVESFGGTLTCESRLGVGTTFRLSLPTVSSLVEGTTRFTPVGAAHAASLKRPARTSVPPSGLRRAHMLIIDEDPGVLETLEEVLSEHDVVIATTASEAHETLERASFELVLCDLDLYQREWRTLRPAFERDAEHWVFCVASEPGERTGEDLLGRGSRMIDKPLRSERLWQLLSESPADAEAKNLSAP
jgi:PAS domain S-box-containing protein